MAKRQSLESWIREALTDPEQDKPCSALGLVHNVGGTEREVYTVKLGNPAQKWTEQSLAEMFLHKAEGHSQDLPGVQTFTLLAFYGTSEPGTSRPFTTRGVLDYDSWGLTTEGPTEQGKTQQNMRLTEALVQGSFKQNAYTFDKLESLVGTLGGFATRTMKQNEELMDTIKVMVAEQATNRHAFQMEQLKMERENQLIAEGTKLLPSLANTLTGKQIFPQSNADSALIEKLAQSLNEDQIRMLSQKLPADVWAMLGQRLLQEMKKNPQPTQPANGKSDASISPKEE